MPQGRGQAKRKRRRRQRSAARREDRLAKQTRLAFTDRVGIKLKGKLWR